MTFESMKFTNFNQLRKYSNLSENDNNKKFALKNNLGKILKSDIDFMEKKSSRKKKHLKILDNLDDKEEEELNKKFYDNFLNDLLGKEKRFKTKSNHKNKRENNIPVQKKSAKLLRFNKLKFASSLFNKTSNEQNNNINKINNEGDLIEINEVEKYVNKNQIKNLKNKYMPTTFEQQLELEEKERENTINNNNINNSNNNQNEKFSVFYSSKKNSSSYILAESEKRSEKIKLKFLNKEIPYFKNENNNNNNEINVNSLTDKKSIKNTFQGDLEEKKQSLNIIPECDNNYVINNDIEKKNKKFCFCCIPII